MTTAADTFTRADSASSLGTADTGQVWSALSGTWGIASNKGYLVSTTGQAVAVIDPGSADGVLSIDVISSATANRTDAGIVFRVADDNNYMLVTIVRHDVSNEVALWKRVGGTFTQLATAMSGAVADGTTYTIEATYNGSTIEVRINGVLRFSYSTATGLEANTKVGIRVNATGSADNGGSRFDNLTFSPAPTSVAGSKATESDTANAGAAFSTAVLGVKASETDSGSHGAPIVVVFGSKATETDSGAAGSAGTAHVTPPAGPSPPVVPPAPEGVPPLTIPLPGPVGPDRGVDAEFSLRSLSNLTAELATVSPSAFTWDDPEHGAGSMRLVVSDDDPNIGWLTTDRALVVLLDGTEAFTVIVDELTDDELAPGEEGDEHTVADGRMLCSILDRVRVKPTRGYRQRPWSDARTFSCGSLEYVPGPEWVNATELSSSQLAPTEFYKGLPVGWFDPSAKWIAPSTGDDTEAQTGIWWAIGDFTLAEDTDLVLIFAADNAATVFFDGFKISDVSTDVGFGQTSRYTITATAGTHRIMARVANYVQTTITEPPYGGGPVDEGNPTAFICTCFTVDARGALGPLVIHTDFEWSVNEYPLHPPGMTIRQVARIILEENKAESSGLLPLVSIDGSDIRDHHGALWEIWEFITVDVGRSLLQLLTEWSGLYCDWAMPGPTNLTLQMWRWKRRGDDTLGVTYEQTSDPDTSSLQRLTRAELALVADALQVRWSGGWLRVPETGGTKVGVIKPSKAASIEEATRVATQVLALYGVVREMWSGEVTPTTDGDVPYLDYRHADSITLGSHFERVIGLGGRLTDDGIVFDVQTKDPIRSAIDRIEAMLAQLADGTLGGTTPASPSGSPPKFGVESGVNQQTWSAPDPLVVGGATKIDVLPSSGNLFQIVILLATPGSTDTAVEFLCDFGSGPVDVLGGGGVIPAGEQKAVIPVDYLGLSTVFVEGLETILSVNVTAVGTDAAGLTLKPVWL